MAISWQLWFLGRLELRKSLPSKERTNEALNLFSHVFKQQQPKDLASPSFSSCSSSPGPISAIPSSNNLFSRADFDSRIFKSNLKRNGFFSTTTRLFKRTFLLMDDGVSYSNTFFGIKSLLSKEGEISPVILHNIWLSKNIFLSYDTIQADRLLPLFFLTLIRIRIQYT